MPHAAIERQLALLPLYITGIVLAWQLVALLSPAGPRDAAGLPKGHDFSHFYTLGTIARTGEPWQLYDPRALTETMWRVVPETKPDAFQPVYGPQVALAFAPFAALAHTDAVRAWLATSAALYALASILVVSLARGLRARRVSLAVLLALSPALNVLLVSGQTSAVALLSIAVSWWALERGRPFAAGLALGVLAYKPSLAAGAVAVLLVAGEWRMLAGLVATAAAQLVVATAWAGPAVMLRYAAALVAPAQHAGMVVSQPQHLHSLAGFFRLLAGDGPLATTLYAASAAAVVLVAGLAWRRGPDASRRIALLVVATVLAAPHLYVYDLVVLAPALVVAWEWAETAAGTRPATWAGVAAWLAWFAPLTGPIALATRVQVSTPVFAGLLVLLSRSRRADTPVDVRP